MYYREVREMLSVKLFVNDPPSKLLIDFLLFCSL